jgi:cold shock CspA family protein
MAQTGVVKFFNGERGYGFIKPDDGGRDVFVHITAVEQAGLKGLKEGQRPEGGEPRHHRLTSAARALTAR